MLELHALIYVFFFFSSRRRHTRSDRDWSSDVCSSDLIGAFGKLDAIVNNAAYVKRSDIHTTDADLFDRVMGVNVRAPLLIIRAALPHLQIGRASCRERV